MKRIIDRERDLVAMSQTKTMTFPNKAEGMDRVMYIEKACSLELVGFGNQMNLRGEGQIVALSRERYQAD